MERVYRISFKIRDLGFEIESTDSKWLEKKQKECFEVLRAEALKWGERLPKDSPQNVVSATSLDASATDLSINEFYRKYIGQRQIKSRSTIAAFFVYYLQRVSRKGEISTSNVTDCFKQVSYPNWNGLNMTDILRKAKSRAFLNYVGNLWSLTTTGEDFILNTIMGKE